MGRPRFDWHFVTFWGSLGVAGVFMVSSALSKDGKPHTIFDEQGRYEFKKFIRYQFPKYGERWFPYEVHYPPGYKASTLP